MWSMTVLAKSTFPNARSHRVQTCDSVCGKRFVIGIHAGRNMPNTRVVSQRVHRLSDLSGGASTQKLEET